MNRSTKILIGVFVLLAVIVAFFFFPSTKEREMSYTAADVSIAVDSASVTGVEIASPGKSFVFENTGGTWMITSPARFTANAEAIATLLGELHRFKAGSPVSSNPAKQSLYQVDSTGVRLTVTQRSGAPFSLIVGKAGPAYSDVYFRLPSSNDVYLGEGLSTWTLRQELKEWRDKTILTVPSDSISEIDYAYKSRTATFRREGTRWVSAGGKDSVAADVMSGVINTLSNFRAEDFIDSAAPAAPNPVNLRLRSGGEVSFVLSPAAADSSHFMVQSSQSAQVYTVSKWAAQQILKPFEKMLK